MFEKRPFKYLCVPHFLEGDVAPAIINVGECDISKQVSITNHTSQIYIYDIYIICRVHNNPVLQVYILYTPYISSTGEVYIYALYINTLNQSCNTSYLFFGALRIKVSTKLDFRYGSK